MITYNSEIFGRAVRSVFHDENKCLHARCQIINRRKPPLSFGLQIDSDRAESDQIVQTGVFTRRIFILIGRLFRLLIST